MTRLKRQIAHYNDPSFDGLRTKSGRRRVVIEGLALAIGVTVLTVGLTAFLQGYLNLALSLPITVGAWWLWIDRVRVSTRGLTELPESVLDERQRIVRAQAFERSYRIVVLGFLVIAVLALIDRFIGLDASVYFLVALVLILIGVATPPLALAFIEASEQPTAEDVDRTGASS